MSAQYLTEFTQQGQAMVEGLDLLSQTRQAQATVDRTSCPHDPAPNGDGTYLCECGWHGRADDIQFSREHLLTVEGVLTAHVRGRPGRFCCKDCGNVSYTLEKFGACLDSHRLGLDGVSAIKNAFGREYVVKTKPVTTIREEFGAFLRS